MLRFVSGCPRLIIYRWIFGAGCFLNIAERRRPRSLSTAIPQAIALAARVLTDPGDFAVIEDPGYLGARSALEAAGMRLLPVKVAKDGLCVERLPKKHPAAKLVYVTPSHQFPSGVVLSFPKRLQLLDWAARNGAWILEDDFDSEYRYESKPIPALQGLDQHGRVIYIGTFLHDALPFSPLGLFDRPRG